MALVTREQQWDEIIYTTTWINKKWSSYPIETNSWEEIREMYGDAVFDILEEKWSVTVYNWNTKEENVGTYL